MPHSVYDEEMRLIKKFTKQTEKIKEFAKKQFEWRMMGPIRFAEEELKVDPITRQPIQLSDGQKEFLNDIVSGKIKLAIITAARGAGKTFALAVYITWRIFSHSNYSIGSMGGSDDQSEKIRQFITGWIRINPNLEVLTLTQNEKIIKTYSNSFVNFYSCSGTSVRGGHVNDLIIDEQAAGEERGGTKHIRAALWQVSTSPDVRIIQSSTAHLAHGDFIQTWNEAEKLGYKRYRWSLVKHISGEMDPLKIYQDKNPNNWFSAVPWSNDETIRILRKQKGDTEWLTEGLGGISISSGLVFNPSDIVITHEFCERCEEEECHPYEENICPLIQMVAQVILGIKEENISSSVKIMLRFIVDRVLGIDWGRGSPTAYVVLGKYKGVVFVLEHHELTGLTDQEKIEFAIELIKKWDVEIVRPDPREWSLNNLIAEQGYAVHELFKFEGGKEKYKYLATLKKYVERHQLIIPKCFDILLRSLGNLSYDDEGKIRKHDDHSADAIMYAISYYDELVSTSPLYEMNPEEKHGVNLW